MLEQWIRSDILAQPAYTVRGERLPIKLNQNESPYDWPQPVKAAVAQRIAESPWNRYPEQIPTALAAKLAGHLQVAAEQLVLGNGSNEVLQALAAVVLRPGDKVAVLSPTFAVYGLLARRSGAELLEVPLHNLRKPDSEQLREASSRSRLTILCNPNSPTGTLLPVGTIEEIVKLRRGLVVVDEAYFDFAGETALALLADNPNLIITRTFSKAFSLAGFRFGYGIMSPALAREVRKGLLPFNLDAPTTIAAETVLDYQDTVSRQVAEIVRERERVSQALNAIPGFAALPSHTNFFLLKSPDGSEVTFQALQECGILVRDVSNYPGCKELLRITVGNPRENDALIQALEALV